MPATSENLIVWGDCDAAGIVYYPRFFYFIDCAFQALLRKAGLDNRILFERFGVRVPIIDVSAKFVGPATFEDKLTVDAKVVHWGTKSFRISYRGSREDAPVFEGTEVRVWAIIAADGSISTAAIAPQFKAALSAVGDGDT